MCKMLWCTFTASIQPSKRSPSHSEHEANCVIGQLYMCTLHFGLKPKGFFFRYILQKVWYFHLHAVYFKQWGWSTSLCCRQNGGLSLCFCFKTEHDKNNKKPHHLKDYTERNKTETERGTWLWKWLVCSLFRGWFFKADNSQGLSGTVKVVTVPCVSSEESQTQSSRMKKQEDPFIKPCLVREVRWKIHKAESNERI